MDAQITTLEQRIDQLINAYEQVKTKNRALEVKNQALLQENQALVDKNTQASERIAAVLTRLDVMSVDDGSA